MKLAAAMRADSIFAPLMEPEVSTTRATSRGSRWPLGSTGGASIQRPT